MYVLSISISMLWLDSWTSNSLADASQEMNKISRVFARFVREAIGRKILQAQCEQKPLLNFKSDHTNFGVPSGIPGSGPVRLGYAESSPPNYLPAQSRINSRKLASTEREMSWISWGGDEAEELLVKRWRKERADAGEDDVEIPPECVETGYCGFGDACKFLHDRGIHSSCQTLR
ncbi:hypothetical protein B0H11DRAFT_1940623 [Mycena galericulata]|nr:hypothetical protein B0H11DRAFT_1940623 [Mycena galericulata]